MATLGPRFLLFRPALPDRRQVAERAILNTDQDRMRAELAEATRNFLTGLVIEAPVTSKAVVSWLATVADVVTRARSPVSRNGYARDIDARTEPEMPARVARQLHALLQGVVLVNGRRGPEPTDLRTIARVGLDMIPPDRRHALQALYQAENSVTLSHVQERLRLPPTTVLRTLEDLEALDLIKVSKAGAGFAAHYHLEPGQRDAIRAAFDPQALDDTPQAEAPAIAVVPLNVVQLEMVASGDLAGG
jgi:DNA-binding MarR family transcriptional regulator